MSEFPQGKNQPQNHEVWESGLANTLPIPEPVTYDDALTPVWDMPAKLREGDGPFADRPWETIRKGMGGKFASGEQDPVEAARESDRVVEDLELTHDQIAGVVEGFVNSANEAYDENGEPLHFYADSDDPDRTPTFAVEVTRSLSTSRSPFAYSYTGEPQPTGVDPVDVQRWPSDVYTLTNLRTGAQTAFTRGTPVLARHSFYGESDPKRNYPRELAAATGLIDQYEVDDPVVQAAAGNPIDTSTLDPDQTARLDNLHYLGHPNIPDVETA